MRNEPQQESQQINQMQQSIQAATGFLAAVSMDFCNLQPKVFADDNKKKCENAIHVVLNSFNSLFQQVEDLQKEVEHLHNERLKG